MDGVWVKEIGDAAIREELAAEIKTKPPRLAPEEREGMVKAAEVIEVRLIWTVPSKAILN